MISAVIPDSHQQTKKVEYILKAESQADEFVFLGDWVDSFEEPPEVTSFEKTCEYLRYLVLEHPLKDKFEFLVGNHDMIYIYNNNGSSRRTVRSDGSYSCSGFTGNKAKMFRKVFYDNGLRDEFFHEHFKLMRKTQGFLCSHAGLHEYYIPAFSSAERVVNELALEAWRNFRNTQHPSTRLIQGVGRSRGGPDQVGGLIWLDWTREFEPSLAIGKQIVGHTKRREPECLGQGTLSESWCIDTNLNHYMVIEDGTPSIKEIPFSL